MIKTGSWVGCVVLAAALVASGCVSKGTFEKLESDKNQEIAALQTERQALQAERQTLQKQRAELQQQIDSLDAQRSALEQQKASLERDSVTLQTRVGLLAQERTTLERQQAELKKQIDALEQQKAQLLAASQQTQSQYDALVRNLTDEVNKGQLQVRQYKNMLTVDVAEQLFFDSGQASLKDSGKEVLKKVGDALKAYDDKVIRIIGHTDNVPIAKALQKVFPSNWELSVARATTVVRYLQEVGIPPERLIATGRAEYAPVAPNDSAEGRKKNRRIEITLIDRALAQETTPAVK
jgi:chemotaxis protein MotB